MAQYYVIDGNSGQKYGPADLATLNQWAREGRVRPDARIEDAILGTVMMANQVPGIEFPTAPPTAPMPNPGMGYQPPSTGSPYPRGFETPPSMGPQAGDKEVTNSWIYLALGFACCGIIFYPLSITSANRALAMGNERAKTPRIIAIVMTVLMVIGIIFYGIAMVAGLSSGTVNSI